jgi:hypothetical protein
LCAISNESKNPKHPGIGSMVVSWYIRGDKERAVVIYKIMKTFEDFIYGKINESELLFNVNSTIDGYVKIKEEDPTLSYDNESSFDKLIITDPSKFYNFRYDRDKDNKNLSSIDSENVLRIRIGSRDFTGRGGGVTHVSVRVPKNFDYNKFQSELPNIKIPLTNKTEVDRIIKEVEALVTKCTGEAPTVFMDTKPDTKINYEQEIYKQAIVINFIKSIEEKIGKEETKKIFIDIINNL